LADLLQVPVVALSEPESAALGGALQALWVARRATEKSLSIEAVARPYVIPSSEASAPNPKNAPVYQALLQRFEAETARLYASL
jgi:sugar (pentulose or hexulose) kinase